MTRSRHARSALVWLPLLLATVGGCSDGDEGTVGPAEVDVDAGESDQDVAVVADTGVDTAVAADTAAKDAGQDGGPMPGDAGPVTDASPDVAADCPGGPGCACEANSDCDTALCIDVAGGKQCAAKCVDTCPAGFACVTAGSGDVLSICAPLYDQICDPCEASEQCQGLGHQQAVCVDQGASGRFCGIPCVDDAICPQGYACKSVLSVEGATSQQCVREPDASSDSPGACPCSASASQKKLSTTCLIQSKNDKGEVIGACPGSRSCGAAGLGDCMGPPPAAEKCDGLDNDCDGGTDEQTCDDDNPCTTDGCDPSLADASKDGCVHIKVDSPCDADGSVCTESDACQSGICVPGKAKDCSDNNPCTADACHKDKGCGHTPEEGKACDDGDPCTVADACAAGSCGAGPAKSCPASGPCIIGQCDPTTGGCAYKKLSAACNDGNACTEKDGCDDGFCAGSAVSCDDSNPCTADTCDKSKGCNHAPNNAPCDDGSKCTAADKCQDGACVGLANDVTASCGDGNPCTADSCDKAKGCLHTPVSSGCDDGNPCTTGDLCKASVCTSGTNTCQCTDNAGCAGKEDGDLCNGTLFCDTSKAPYVCKVNPATTVTCAKDKDTTCLSNTCDGKSGKCALLPTAEDQPCDADGSKCTLGDSCVGGNCAAGKAVSCDDGNPCTQDSCDKVKGCVNALLAGSCDDGDACTTADHCDTGVCLPGKAAVCDDGNDCTTDSCDKAKGCVVEVLVGKSFACYSGKAGTKDVGTCKGGLRTCQADGTLGPCAKEVVPAAKEACDGLDDDCDGETDIGCAAVDFRFVQGNARLSGTSGDKELRAMVGAGGAGGTGTAGVHTMKLGAYAWLRALLMK